VFGEEAAAQVVPEKIKGLARATHSASSVSSIHSEVQLVNKLLQHILRNLLAFLAALGVPVVPTRAQGLQLEAKTSIADGLHPWYEVKADPQNPKNVIICGSKWNARLNSLLGFVYASSDAGATWQAVLEDRNSRWVSEHSCAFGPNHKAYFISEASKVIDGKTHHKLGTTRLYVSTDGGQHWAEEIKTGWADHSASAVSFPAGRLYTFFNSTNTVEPGRAWGSNVGLLVFSADGKKVTGPFFNSKLQDRDYHGIYPFYAITLNSGTVVCLYHGITRTGMEQDLAIMRADQSPEPSLESTVIARTKIDKECPAFDHGSLTYDSESNRLFLVYGDGCRKRRIVLTSSEDEGRTWTKSKVLTDPQSSGRTFVGPSLVVGSGGALGLLWEEEWFSGRWLFSALQDNKLVEPEEASHRRGLAQALLSQNKYEEAATQYKRSINGISMTVALPTAQLSPRSR
jgi:hypothetical protein